MNNSIYVAEKAFQKILWPTLLLEMGAVLLEAIDSMIVANLCGQEGLRLEAMFLPVTYSVMAVFIGISLGGATVFGYRLGDKDQPGAQSVFSGMLTFTLVGSLLLTMTGFCFVLPLQAKLNAITDGMQALSPQLIFDFGRWIYLSIPLMALSLFLLFFVRSDSAPQLTVMAMTVELIVHVTLDFILIKEIGLGVQGASLAWFFAQIACVLVYLSHFIAPGRQIRFCLTLPSLRDVWSSFQAGFTVTLDFLYDPIVLLVFNTLIIASFDTSQTIIILVLIYGFSFMNGFYSGLGESVISLTAIFFGSKDFIAVRHIVRRCVFYGLIMAFSVSVIMLIWPDIVLRLYNVQTDDPSPIRLAVRLFALSLPFGVWNACIIYAYQALEHFRSAVVLSLSRGLCFLLLFSGLAIGLKSIHLFMLCFFLNELLTFLVWLGIVLWNRRKCRPFALLMLQPNPEVKLPTYAALIKPDTQTLADWQNAAQDFLKQQDVSPKTIYYTLLGLEEIVVYVLAQHRQVKNAYIDFKLTVDSTKTVTISTRFEGDVVDMMTAVRKSGLITDKFMGLCFLYRLSKRFDYSYIMGFNCVDVVI